MSKCYVAFDLKIKLGHSELHFMEGSAVAQW